MAWERDGHRTAIMKDFELVKADLDKTKKELAELQKRFKALEKKLSDKK
jgi:BMFP domain-containing protein YqiC